MLQGILKEPNLAKEAGLGLLGMVTAYGRGDLGGVANTAMGILKRVTKGDSAQSKALKTKTSPADVIMWSGSKDTQKSYVHLPLFELFSLGVLYLLPALFSRHHALSVLVSSPRLLAYLLSICCSLPP